MLGAFAQAFRTPDLRRKLLFTLFIMAAFRLGSFIPTPGVDSQAVQRCMAQESQASLLDLVNLFSGGALLQLSIFALGIMPYITASIITRNRSGDFVADGNCPHYLAVSDLRGP